MHQTLSVTETQAALLEVLRNFTYKDGRKRPLSPGVAKDKIHRLTKTGRRIPDATFREAIDAALNAGQISEDANGKLTYVPEGENQCPEVAETS